MTTAMAPPSADVGDRYAAPMPESERRQHTVLLEDDLWKALQVAGNAVEMNRSALIRQFCRWYVGVPGAQLPPRPGSTD